MENNWWLFIGVILVAIAIWAIGKRQQTLRTRDIQKISKQLGLKYCGDDEGMRKELFFNYPLFQKGMPNARPVTNILRGTRGDLEIMLFDYAYQTQSYPGRGFEFRPFPMYRYKTYRQTVLALRFQTGVFPAMEMHPARLRDRLGNVLGVQRIEFDSFPEFEKNYVLRGKAEPAIRNVFGPAVLGYLTEDHGWWLEANGEWIVLYREGERVAPSDLPTFLQKASHLAGLLRRG